MPGGARLQILWKLGRVFGVGVLLLVSAPPLPASAAETRGVATQDGWWNRLQGPAEGEPEGNPVRPLVPALPKPPTVPADSIAAGVTAGQVDKVAAVGLDVALEEGATLDGLVLRLKESGESGANVDAAKAKVVACPATAPWGPGQNAAWADRPAADCNLGSAEGTRGDDGTWTFDLAALGRLWADPFAPLAPHGVVLSVDPAASPSAVQVSWLNLDSGHVAVELTATPGGPAPAFDSGPAAPDVSAANAPALATPPTADPGTDTGAFPTSAEGSFAALPAGSSGQPADASALPAAAGPSETVTPPEPPTEVPLSAAPDPSVPVLRARSAVDFWESVPGPTALLVPVAAGLAVVIGVALGPVGRPSPVLRREGGLSRALARRGATGRGAA